MQRVVVVGNSGSGKTTLARALADRLRAPCLELDGVFHQPNWTPLPADEFRARVATIVARPRWVIDGNYSAVREVVWPRADTVVWLDLPRARVISQVVRRTVRRGLRRQELWNGNREDLRNVLRRDRDVNIVLWSWTNHAGYRQRMTAASTDPAHAHLDFVRLRSRRQSRAWLDTVPR